MIELCRNDEVISAGFGGHGQKVARRNYHLRAMPGLAPPFNVEEDLASSRTKDPQQEFI